MAFLYGGTTIFLRQPMKALSLIFVTVNFKGLRLGQSIPD